VHTHAISEHRNHRSIFAVTGRVLVFYAGRLRGAAPRRCTACIKLHNVITSLSRSGHSACAHAARSATRCIWRWCVAPSGARSPCPRAWPSTSYRPSHVLHPTPHTPHPTPLTPPSGTRPHGGGRARRPTSGDLRGDRERIPRGALVGRRRGRGPGLARTGGRALADAAGGRSEHASATPRHATPRQRQRQAVRRSGPTRTNLLR